MDSGDERAWKYMVDTRDFDPENVAANTQISVERAKELISSIGTPLDELGTARKEELKRHMVQQQKAMLAQVQATPPTLSGSIYSSPSYGGTTSAGTYYTKDYGVVVEKAGPRAMEWDRIVRVTTDYEPAGGTFRATADIAEHAKARLVAELSQWAEDKISRELFNTDMDGLRELRAYMRDPEHHAHFVAWRAARKLDGHDPKKPLRGVDVTLSERGV